MRTFRFVLICLVALGLAPGTWLRTPLNADPDNLSVTVTKVAIDEHIRGELEIMGAWTLTSNHPMFGGFSALVAEGDDALVSGTDRGWILQMALKNGGPLGADARFTTVRAYDYGARPLFDLEAMARDPATGAMWLAFENANVLQRSIADGAIARRRPPEMRRWSANSGPETLIRLDDGAFIVIGEGPERRGITTRPGLLFEADPVEEGDPVQFRVTAPPRYSPVDGTAMPDGSVLLLLRKLEIAVPAKFDAAIMRADPADIEEGGVWSGEVLAYLDGPVLGENFEGITFVPDADDPEGASGSIYVIADDNLSIFQRNLLLRLAWPPTSRHLPNNS